MVSVQKVHTRLEYRDTTFGLFPLLSLILFTIVEAEVIPINITFHLRMHFQQYHVSSKKDSVRNHSVSSLFPRIHNKRCLPVFPIVPRSNMTRSSVSHLNLHDNCRKAGLATYRDCCRPRLATNQQIHGTEPMPSSPATTFLFEVASRYLLFSNA